MKDQRGRHTNNEMKAQFNGIGMPERVTMFAVFDLEVPDQVNRLLMSLNSLHEGIS